MKLLIGAWDGVGVEICKVVYRRLGLRLRGGIRG